MKMIIRADDVGYTDVCNIGAFRTFEEGCCTSADVMLDTPGAEDALRRLKEMPWISVGWHNHFWGSPVLDPSLVPSLYDPATGHFRQDLHTAEDISADELLAECRAQMDRCISILGRAPDTGGMMPDTVFGRVCRQICEEYGMVYDFINRRREKITFDGMADTEDAAGKFAHCNIVARVPGFAFDVLRCDSIADQMGYDPLSYYTQDMDGCLPLMREGATVLTMWHPGYLDYYVIKLGDQGPFADGCLFCRAMDAEMLSSQPLKDWIIENKIELVNTRDAIYGTNDYQNHLRAIGSPLYMR